MSSLWIASFLIFAIRADVADSCHSGFASGDVVASSERGLAMFDQQDRAQLEALQLQALQYFLDNQLPHGLILDRQRNHSASSSQGWCSTAATGMGLIAIALSSAPEYRLLSRRTAITRVRLCLKTALERLPEVDGMMPHFVDATTLQPVGDDVVSTIDSSWLVAGALWAASFLDDAELKQLSDALYSRIDWQSWAQLSDSGDSRWLCHGQKSDGSRIASCWDRLNAETAFMYVMAIGAERGNSLPAKTWRGLRKHYGTVAGARFGSADLGLFSAQYSLSLLDFEQNRWPGRFDLQRQSKKAVEANHRYCLNNRKTFKTFKRFWGLSAGDGPGDSGQDDQYRAYAPGGPVDGTAHLTATLASVEVCPELVLENLRAVRGKRFNNAHGRYGLSNINLDRGWVSRDVVAIDLGAAVLAIDNALHDQRVRKQFHALSCIEQATKRLGVRPRR